MNPKDEIDYDNVREAEHRLASANALDTPARNAHRELADRYADRAWANREAGPNDLADEQ